MKWMQRPSRLIKRLKELRSNGRKLYEIRKAKRASQKDLLEYFEKNDVQMDRKTLSLIEDGVKPVLDYMMEPWLKFLEVTAKEAMLEVAAKPAEEAPEPEAKVAASPVKRGSKIIRPEQKVQFVNHAEGNCFEFFVERDKDGLIVVHVFLDEPVPKSTVDEAVGNGSSIAKTWVDQPAVKYAHSPNRDDQKIVPRKVTVTLK